MLPYDDLKRLASHSDTHPLLAHSLKGATAEITAPAGRITHAILDTGYFPNVLIAIEGERGRTRTRDFFSLPPALYEDSEWSFIDLDAEASIAEAISNAARFQADDARSSKPSYASGRPQLPTNPVRQANAEEWLDIYRARLQTALRVPASRRKWSWMIKDISKLQNYLDHPKDRDFIGSFGFVWSTDSFSPSPGQAKRIDDIARKLLAKTAPNPK